MNPMQENLRTIIENSKAIVYCEWLKWIKDTFVGDREIFYIKNDIESKEKELEQLLKIEEGK